MMRCMHVWVMVLASLSRGPAFAQETRAKAADANAQDLGPSDPELRREYETLMAAIRELRPDGDARAALDVRVSEFATRLLQAEPLWSATLATSWGARLQTIDPQSGLVHVDAAIATARAANNQRQIALSLLERGNLCRALSRNQEALAAIDEATELLVSIGDPEHVAHAAINRASALYALSRPEEALISLDHAERFFADAGDQRRLARIATVRGDVLFTLGRYQEALVACDHATALFEKTGDREQLANVDVSRGVTLMSLSQYHEALIALDRAVAFFAESADSWGLSEAIFNRGLVLHGLTRYEGALAAYDQAGEFFLSVGDDGRFGVVIANRARALGSLGRHEEALAALDQAMELLSKYGDERGLAGIAENRGIVLHFLRRHGEALEAYDHAIRCNKRVGDQNGLAVTAINRANLLLNLGRFQEALAGLDEAAVFFHAAGDRGQLATIAVSHGAAFRSLGRYDEALQAYDEAERFFREAGVDRTVATLALNRAAVLELMMRYDEALAVLAEAEAFFSKVSDQGRLADVTLNRGNVLRSMYRDSEALAAYDRAEQLSETANDPERSALIAMSRGSLYRFLDRQQESLAALDSAARYFDKIGDHGRLATIALNRGDVLQQLQQHAEAFAAYRRCAELVGATLQRQVQKLGEISSSSWRSKYRKVVASALTSCRDIAAAQPGVMVDAYELMQTFHGLGLAEQLADGATLGTNAIPPDLRQRHAVALERLHQAIAARDSIRNDNQAVLAAKDEVRSREGELDQIVERARLRSRMYVDLSHPKPSPLAEVQAALATGTALVEYALGDEHSWAIVTTKTRSDLVKLGDGKAIDSEVDWLAKVLSKGLTPKLAELRGLAEKVLDPVLAGLGPETETLLFSPHGALCRIPFEVLLTSTPAADVKPEHFPFLIARYDVGYVHSGTAFVAMREHARGRQRAADALEFVGIGHPFDAEAEGQGADAARPTLAFLERERGDRGPLPGSAVEVLSIARTFAATAEEHARLEAALQTVRDEPLARSITSVAGEKFHVWLRDAAAEHILKTDLLIKNARFLHLACHAEADLTSPSLSRLVLSRAASIAKSSGEDGYVYVRDVRDLDVHCELLVLSACESTLGKLSAVDGMTGLARAGLAAGARAVLSTLWRVSDGGAQEFALSFYRNLCGRGGTRLRALGDAKREAIARGSPLRTWSAYVLWDAEVER